ncbi:glycerate kinase family protein [Anditalea andensis]|uniref:Glycerate kinase n=1 Tax=Anditalea andensis TaxID=1048983 RepID=A0A074KU22_9BACT|nr:glycerate kinase [Anditalea andensis]KEO72414.1 glycerate kinase [Anditalea andensis]
MNILIAPNAFKGTMTAEEAAQIIKEAICQILPDDDFILCPIADGGDGTSFLLAKAMDMPLIHLMALDAIGRPLPGYLVISKDGSRAIMDVSTVSGIRHLALDHRDPFLAGTYGTGEMIAAAISKGAAEIVLGLGGTASIDMGAGILRGLGFLFLDDHGREIPMFSPFFMNKIRYIQRPIKKHSVKFTLLCDVHHSFFGDNGAIAVFGPQKGLQADQTLQMEKNCMEFYHLLQKKSGKKLDDLPGYGAAGGIAFGLSAFYPVEIKNGSEFFFHQVGMADKVRKADLIITGEGRYDTQSDEGKGCFKLMQLAAKWQKQIILITSGNDGAEGFDDIIRLPSLDERDVIRSAKNLLYTAVRDYFNKK